MRYTKDNWIFWNFFHLYLFPDKVELSCVKSYSQGRDMLL